LKNSGENASLMSWRQCFLRGLHNACGTRLWTACTRLIMQQINESVFY